MILSSIPHFTFAPSYDLLAPDIWKGSLVPSQLIQNVSAKHRLRYPAPRPPGTHPFALGKEKLEKYFFKPLIGKRVEIVTPSRPVILIL